MLTKEAVYSKLKQVIDPELHVNIVDLGLIYDVAVFNQTSNKSSDQKTSILQPKVRIVMTLTTPTCPLAGVFQKMIKDTLKELDGIKSDADIQIELTFDPPWVIDMMDQEARAKLEM